ncbi:type III-B CRISPR module RAMP protein Cmr6 [Thermogemmatispora tikiterensis]|uniref:Type III-B CRISPR module RAMP protein Cmr6 n=1 Tax=Thermogemmatispora tikiterensis TaxID=1825093 RepID=A0A328VQW5_9CHLR|nr:type III-B CRISPR module RAMP protein Cmr6 [Thermogemmatispora tikiterensis]RAQ98093.1 type III-B CRISPR module RAMP protein Cmr6 [Thermogemmatispora tikiterensis]
MVVGLGGNSVLETDLTLHRNYSLPIIPGSALKGLTRSYAEQERKISRSNEPENSKELYITEDDLKRIFGTLDQAGSVIFFDAMPLNGEARLELDVMTPHYPDYYQKKKRPPSNDQQPVPIAFLTVAKTTFTFAIAPRSSSSSDQADAQKARDLLELALADYGIGGKTSAGYGYFRQAAKSPAANSAPFQEEKGEGLEEARAKARELAALTPEQLKRKDRQELLKELGSLPSLAAKRLLAREIEKIHRQKGVDLQRKAPLFRYIQELLQQENTNR